MKKQPDLVTLQNNSFLTVILFLICYNKEKEINMEDKILKDLSLEELKELKSIIKKYSNLAEFTADLQQEIVKKETARTKISNSRFRISSISTFSLEERKILKENGIYTIEDLTKVNVKDLKGVDANTRQSLQWAKDFYNMEKRPLQRKTASHGRKK